MGSLLWAYSPDVLTADFAGACTTEAPEEANEDNALQSNPARLIAVCSCFKQFPSLAPKVFSPSLHEVQEAVSIAAVRKYLSKHLLGHIPLPRWPAVGHSHSIRHAGWPCPEWVVALVSFPVSLELLDGQTEKAVEWGFPSIFSKIEVSLGLAGEPDGNIVPSICITDRRRTKKAAFHHTSVLLGLAAGPDSIIVPSMLISPCRQTEKAAFIKVHTTLVP